MKYFEYLGKYKIECNDIYTLTPIEAPESNYEVTFKYYINPNKQEGYFKANKDFIKIFPIGVLYIRYNHDTTYYTFEYEGDIEINISIKDNVRYTNLLNIIEIKNNLLNDWDSIKQHISHKTEKRS